MQVINTYKAWRHYWPSNWALSPSAYSAVSSAVQTTKVLQEPIQTTEKWRWKNFYVLRADRLPLRTFTHCLRHWPYHSKL